MPVPQSIPLLDALPAGERDRLVPLLTERMLREDEVLLPMGEPISALWLLTGAVVARVALHRSGVMQEAGLSGHGTIAGAFGLIGDGASPWEVRVRRAGTALRLGSEHFPELHDATPQFVAIVERVACSEAAGLASEFALRSCRSARACVAGRLLDYFETLEEPVLRITHRQLASRLALRRATVTIALQELEAVKAVRARRGAIELVNAERLSEAALA